MVNGSSKVLVRRGSMAAVCGLAIALTVVVASTTTVVKSLPAALPAGTEVSAADRVGINVLEPASTGASSRPKATFAKSENVEKAVGEWTETGGGAGGGGSPKK